VELQLLRIILAAHLTMFIAKLCKSAGAGDNVFEGRMWSAGRTFETRSHIIIACPT